MTYIRYMISEHFVGNGHNGLQQDVEGNMVVHFVGSKLYMQILLQQHVQQGTRCRYCV
jgi:hypothetical protein